VGAELFHEDRRDGRTDGHEEANIRFSQNAPNNKPYMLKVKSKHKEMSLSY
jgi:hypothetical protein